MTALTGGQAIQAFASKAGPLTLALSLGAAVALGAWMPAAWAQGQPSNCGNPFVNGFGPYDYRTDIGHRKVVEDFHFTPRVEALVGGVSAPLGAELDYTLRAFPNHHRALVALTRLGAKTKQEQPGGAQFTVECYYKRALQFRPDDVVARMLYARFLATGKRMDDALRELDRTVELAKDNPFTHYNAGLVYFEIGQYEKALAQAHRAAELGFTRNELADQLRGKGKWLDPAVVPEGSAQLPTSSPNSTASQPTSN